MTLSPSPSSWDSSGIKDKSTLYRLIAHALPHGAIFVVDETLRYVLADGPELVAAGLTAADIEGAQVHEIAPAAMLEQCVADYRTALSGATFTREHSVGRRHYRTYGLPLNLPNDERRLALAVSYEVSSQTLHTRQLDILSSLERIGGSTSTSGQVVDAVSALLRENFGPSHCVIAEVSCDENTVRDLSGVFNAGGTVPLIPDCFAEEDIDAFAGTSQNVQAVELHCALALHFQSDRAIVVPRVAADGLIGFIAIIPAYEQQFDTDDLELLRLIAGVTWNLVERHDVSAKLASSARARERFLAVLGHELRTPLSTLSSATTLLSHQQPSKQAGDIIAIMDRQIQQMHAIVNDRKRTACTV